jgi:group I intron endonuclease
MKGQFIYKIINTVNGKFYVGSTTNTRERFRTHRNKLRRNKHHTKHLQAAWNKYGESMFVFHVVEEIPDGQSLQDAEDVWLLAHVGQPNCYNAGLRSGAPWRGAEKGSHPNFGKPLSEEMKQSISEGLKEHYSEYDHPRSGKTHSEETKAKISASKLANPVKPWLGKTRDEETRKKIGDAQRGVKKAPRTISEEGRAKIRAAAEAGHYSHWAGKKHTEESKEKMSKPVFVMPDGIMFPSLTAVLKKYDMKMPTLMRALKSGKPISKGRMAGYSFSYGGLGVQITETDRALSGQKV